MDRFYPSNAEDIWRIRTMILSDDVSDDDGTDDGKECDGDCVQPREGASDSAANAALSDGCCNELRRY
jgi:hypothetical protein